MPKYSIIIPVCDNIILTFDCLLSIRNCTSDYEVIIIDNGSKTPFKSDDKIIRNNVNLGFPKAVNQGIKEAKGDIIIILNNDTLVTPHWAERLADHLARFDMVGPVSNCVSGPQQICTIDYELPTDVRVIANDRYFNHTRNGMAYHRLVFFCVAIKREVIDKVGYLDEQFSPGNFEDDDYCLRAIEAGFKLGIAQDVFIYHKGSATHKTLNFNHSCLLQRNAKLFREKWPDSRYRELITKHVQNNQIR